MPAGLLALHGRARKFAVCLEARTPRSLLPGIGTPYHYTPPSQQSARPAGYLCFETGMPFPIHPCWWLLPWKRMARLATLVMAANLDLERNHHDLEVSPPPAEVRSGRGWKPAFCWTVSLMNRRARKCTDLEPAVKV